MFFGLGLGLLALESEGIQVDLNLKYEFAEMKFVLFFDFVKINPGLRFKIIYPKIPRLDPSLNKMDPKHYVVCTLLLTRMKMMAWLLMVG